MNRLRLLDALECLGFFHPALDKAIQSVRRRVKVNVRRPRQITPSSSGVDHEAQSSNQALIEVHRQSQRSTQAT